MRIKERLDLVEKQIDRLFPRTNRLEDGTASLAGRLEKLDVAYVTLENRENNLEESVSDLRTALVELQERVVILEGVPPESEDA